MNKKWFTLIELMIVITIIWIMMMMAYAPYNYFQKKAELRVAAKEISKTLSESRNLAIHWTSSGWINQSIWVYFDKNNKNTIKIFSYDYNDKTKKSLLKEIKIQKDIWIDKVAWNSKALFYYEAITWSWSFYKNENFTSPINTNTIKIDFSYKWTTTNLKKELIYYTKTYLSDY